MGAKPNRRFRNGAFLGAILAAGLLLAGCASQPQQDQISHRQQIESAKTRADHEQLVRYFRQQEAQAREVVLQHRRMAESYLRWGGAGGRAGTGASMASHCRNIAEQYERAAAEYAAVATLHQQLAAQAAN